MNKSILLIALLFAPLSGCLGIPADAIGPGDSVQAVAVVTDADTGAVLLSGTQLDFVVGQGASGLGFEFERQLIGEPDDFDGTVTVRGDPSLQWGRTVDAQARYESDLVQSIPIDQFSQSFGEPVVGESFAPQFAFFDYLVVDVQGDVVFYQPLPEEGQRDPVPAIGAVLVTSTDGDQLIQILDPDVGATFRVAPPSPFNPSTPLGLEPGSYRTVGGDGEVITFEYSPSSNPDLVGHDLVIQVTVQSVRQAQGTMSPEPVDGNYGVRQSGYINGVPSAVPDFGPNSDASGDAMADDGHDH